MSQPQFQINEASHAERLEALRQRATPKQYLDEGPVAFYHLLHGARARGHHGLVEFALKELERLYQLEAEHQNGS